MVWSVSRNAALSGPSEWATSSGPRRCAHTSVGSFPVAAAPAKASPASSSVLRSKKPQSFRMYEAITAMTFREWTVAPRAIGVVTATVSAGSRS